MKKKFRDCFFVRMLRINRIDSMKLVKFLFFICLSCFFAACNDGDEGYDVAFLGDHQVKNWNLEESFPNFNTKNYGGRAASGIQYLDYLKDAFVDSDIVVLLGNSDIPQLAEKGTDAAIGAYCDLLIQAAKLANSRQVYVYSFLPQNWSNATTTERLNTFIKRVNVILAQKVQAAGFIYVDVFNEFYDGFTIKSAYVESDGNSYNKSGYNLLATSLLSVYNK